MKQRYFSFLIFLLSLHISTAQYGGVDEDIVDDIFGNQNLGISSDLCIAAGSSQVCSGNGNCKFGNCECIDGWTGKFCSECQACRSANLDVDCEKYRPCIECSVFGQYWKHFGSAYECRTKCTEFNFINPTPDEEAICTAQYEPVCGLDGRTYGNSCDAEAHGISQQCKGECPCDSSVQVCELHKNLDGDSICPPYRFIVDGKDISVFRPPCLGDDLEVNVGLWKGESAVKDGDRYPNGWGVLTYQDEDVLNRDEYQGNMVYGMREGHGNLYWKDGSYYSGEWSHDGKEGEGTLFYSNGDIYTGHWGAEKKTGEGKYIYNKGGEYIGGFESGRKNGAGSNYVMRPDDQWELFDGAYINGAKQHGSYNSSTGHVYTGDFSVASGEFNGTGVYIWACGKKFSGDFVSGQPSGQGTMTYPQGWSYTGAFCSGEFQGFGKFSWSESHYYEGEFKKGKMTGVGVYAFESGALYDSSVGLYYPDRSDKSTYFEAHFDGKTLRVNRNVAKLQKNTGYGS